MIRALIDTNVLLDVLLDRQPWVDQAKAVWHASDAGRFDGFISAISLPNIFYIARRVVGLDKARAGMPILLEAFDVLPIDRTSLEAAVQMRGNDFEDDVQLASAIAGGMDFIVTRNPRDFIDPRCPPISPADFLAKLTARAPNAT